MKKKKEFRSKALQHVYDRYVADDPEAVKAYEDELLNARIAQQIYELRRKAGLTQRALAERVGTQPSVISRLEDADYEGHSVSMLRRIAEALDQKLEVRMISKKGEKRRKVPA
jgi:ribosome-binding protein aMBF1 (putative translation factor)